MLIRRILAGGTLAALVVLQFDTRLLSFALTDREQSRQVYSQLGDRWGPDFRQFLEGVRAHTDSGDGITLVIPTDLVKSGYSYAYRRASYFLAGRQVFPSNYRADDLIDDNLLRAEYVAVWRSALPPGKVIWKGNGGVLLKVQ